MKHLTPDHFDTRLAGYTDYDAKKFTEYTTDVRRLLSGHLAKAINCARQLQALGVRCGPEFDDFEAIAEMLELMAEPPNGIATEAEVIAGDEEQYLKQIGGIA